MGFKLTTLVVIGTDYVGSCKSNYHTITTTLWQQGWDICTNRYVYKSVWYVLYFVILNLINVEKYLEIILIFALLNRLMKYNISPINCDILFHLYFTCVLKMVVRCYGFVIKNHIHFKYIFTLIWIFLFFIDLN
jgi:hypothetical protein